MEIKSPAQRAAVVSGGGECLCSLYPEQMFPSRGNSQKRILGFGPTLAEPLTSRTQFQKKKGENERHTSAL